jgi:hypothetical protein
MATVVWFFDRLFVPRELEFGGFAVVPLSAADGALEGVAKSFAAHFGLIGEFTPLRGSCVTSVGRTLAPECHGVRIGRLGVSHL